MEYRFYLTVALLELVLVKPNLTECVFEYTSQPPSSTHDSCIPYYVNETVTIINITLECAVRRQSGSNEHFQIRWFRENTTGALEDLGKGSPEEIDNNNSSVRSLYHERELFGQLYSPSLVGKYWCQVINTTADTDQPLMRSNLFTLLPPDNYTGTMCLTVQTMATTICADLPATAVLTTTSTTVPTLSSTTTNATIPMTPALTTTNLTVPVSPALSSTTTNATIPMTATNLTVPLILDITRTHSTLSFPPQHTSSQQQYSTTTIPPHDSSLPTNTSTTLLLYALVPAVLMSLVITVCVISVTSVLCCKRYSKKTLQEQVIENVHMTSIEFLATQQEIQSPTNLLFYTTDTFHPPPSFLPLSPPPPPPPPPPPLPLPPSPLPSLLESVKTGGNWQMQHANTNHTSIRTAPKMIARRSTTSLHEEQRYSAVISELANKVKTSSKSSS